VRPRVRFEIKLVGFVTLAVLGCGHDAADREYLAALRGEEQGMTLEQQIDHLNRAIQINPRRAYYFETRGGYYIGLKQFDKALADLDRNVALKPRPYAFYLRALVTCQMGDIPHSLADFDTAIALQPENDQFYVGRSLARTATGNLAGALADGERLIARVPQRAESWHARGVALAALGRDAEAVRDFDHAASLRPELVYVVESRAKSLERLGEADRAQADRLAVERMRVDRAGCAVCLDPFRY
jgi:tetratricopeptide (TPR) repeat protein